MFSLVTIALATLGPVSIRTPGPDLSSLCLLCGEAGTMDFTLNVVLFVPLGLGVALWSAGRLPMLTAAVMLGLLSLSIELLQATIIVGRHAALGDLIANTLGGVIGLSLPRSWRGALLPPPGWGRLLAWFTFGTGLMVPMATALLLRPSPGRPGQVWHGQWAHVLGGLVPFEGQVLEVRLDTLAVPRYRLPDAQAFRETWHTPLVFEARVLAGPMVDGRAQVAAIADGTGGWVAAIWQEGPDAILSLRLRTSDVRLRTPWVRLRDALSVPAGMPVTLRVTVQQDRIRASATPVSAPPRLTEIRLSPNLTWALFWPWDTAFTSYPAGRTLIWVAAWFSVVAGLMTWWCQGAGMRRLPWALAPASILAVEAAIPAVTGMGPIPAREWAAAALGGLGGVVVASRLHPAVRRGTTFAHAGRAPVAECAPPSEAKGSSDSFHAS